MCFKTITHLDVLLNSYQQHTTIKWKKKPRLKFKYILVLVFKTFKILIV